MGLLYVSTRQHLRFWRNRMLDEAPALQKLVGGGRLSPEVFSRPQPDRTGPQQTQGASAQGEPSIPFRVSCVGSVASLRISARRNAGTFSPCGLCSNLTGICSSLRYTALHRTGSSCQDTSKSILLSPSGRFRHRSALCKSRSKYQNTDIAVRISRLLDRGAM